MRELADLSIIVFGVCLFFIVVNAVGSLARLAILTVISFCEWAVSLAEHNEH